MALLGRATGAVRPTIEAAFRWLEKRLPKEKVTSRFVHGDFRNGNIMFHPDKGVVIALDWELVHVGDPAALGIGDLAEPDFGEPVDIEDNLGELERILEAASRHGAGATTNRATCASTNSHL